MRTDRLRGIAALVMLSLSYARRRPAAAVPALRMALRIGLRSRNAPILRPDASLHASLDEIVPVCSLISDTHLVAARRSPCELEHEPEQWVQRPMPTELELTRGVMRVLEHVARHGPRTVVWCGDEVDSGDPAEWRQWQAAVHSVPGLAHRLVPGNHDICFNRPFDQDYDLARRAMRERAYQQHAGRLADFPIVDTIVGDAGVVTIVLLDSCRHRSTHVLSNAVGSFGDDQLAELERQLRKVRGPVLCVAHHHVWRDARFMQPDDWYNIAIDADRLVAILDVYRARDRKNHVMVCHGHRHVQSAGRIGRDIAVVGMPSSTLGDKTDTGRLDGMMRYGIAGLRRDGSWAIAMQDVGLLMATDSSRDDDTDFAPGLYNTPMQTQLEYRGSFRYIDQRAVDLAIGEAAEHLDDDGISNVDREWMSFVRRNGTTVHVDARLPTSSDRYIAAAVLGALARRAIEGCVDVMRGGHVLDAFAPEA